MILSFQENEQLLRKVSNTSQKSTARQNSRVSTSRRSRASINMKIPETTGLKSYSLTDYFDIITKPNRGIGVSFTHNISYIIADLLLFGRNHGVFLRSIHLFNYRYEN